MLRRLLSAALIASVLLPVGSARAMAANPVAAFLGDSYTEGAGASSSATRWSTLVARRLGWTERTFGHGGTGYFKGSPNEYLGRLDDVVNAAPDIVVVSGGINDMEEFFRDSSAVTQAITDTYSAIRQRLPNVRIIAIGPSITTAAGAVAAREFDADVADAAAAVNGEYVSLLWPSPVIQPDMVLPDNTHVNDEGHAAIANRILAVLQGD